MRDRFLVSAMQVIVFGFVSFFVGGVASSLRYHFKEKKHECYAILHEAENAPLDEYWRRLTGYDSIEVYNSHFPNTGVTVNFCFPNEWAREKFKKDTTSINDRTQKSMTENMRTWRRGIDTVLITSFDLGYWPENLPIDWEWFKKGYVPKGELVEDGIGYVTSVNGMSGPHIYIADTLRLNADTAYTQY